MVRMAVLTGLWQGVVHLQRALQQAHEVRQACSVAPIVLRRELCQHLLWRLAYQCRHRPREIGALEFMVRHTWTQPWEQADALSTVTQADGSLRATLLESWGPFATEAIEMASPKGKPSQPSHRS